MAAQAGGDPWASVREEARRCRAALPGSGSSSSSPDGSAAAEAAVQAALRLAGSRPRLLPPTDTLLSGAHAVLDRETRIVWLRSDVPIEERRVLLAHELAHHYLHDDHGDTDDGCACYEEDVDATGDGEALVGYGPRQRRETEANVFAREFLLPAPLARRWFDEGADAHAIARRAGVPVSLAFAQMEAGLGLHSAAPTPAPPPSRRGEARGGQTSSTLTLDPSQEAAARAESGPLLVGAGPGTGKTRTLTARVLYLTREAGVRPERLLALTFSRKAAEEMRERIGAVAPEVGRRAAISTFHAYGLDLLRRYWREAELPPAPVLLAPVDTFALLERRAGALDLDVLRYLHDPSFPLPDILRTIARAKEEMLTPEAFRRRAEAAGDEKLLEVARVYAAYEALLRERGALDFSDLVYRALRLLEENETVRAAEQAQWHHVLVDEYQDVNRAGARLVRALGGDGGAGLWLVGDLRQAIYAFRGASPANVSSFEEDFPGGRRTELGVNYRSRPHLVALFGVASGEGTGAWPPPPGEAEEAAEAAVVVGPFPPATLAVAPDEIAQADGIARKMRALREAGYAWSDMAILCRTRGQARALRALLSERDVPVAAETGGDYELLRSHDVKNLILLLARACEPDGPARERYPELPAGLPYSGDAYDFFTEALWGAPRLAQQVTDAAGVAALLGGARSFRERSAVVLEPTEEPRRAFLAHLRRMARLGGDLSHPGHPDAAPDAVRLLTVHAAKGLEFPVVFLPNLSAGKFPARPGPSLLSPLPLTDEVPAPDAAEREIEEEERLFFVALTRARDHLILSRAEKYNKRAAPPSPLLGNLAAAPGIVREEWVLPLPRPLSASEKEEKEEGETAKPGSPPRRGDAAESSTDDSAPTDAADAELWLRGPRRYYYERVKNLRGGERSAYGAFKRAVQAALAAPETPPAEALEAAWRAEGPQPDHPLHDLYRAAAEKAVLGRSREPEAFVTEPHPPRRRVAAPEADAAEPPVLTVSLPGGTIAVRPDAATPDLSVVERQTFRRPPKEGEKDAPQDPRLSLLQAATGGKARVDLHYLQNGTVLTAPNRPRVREKHLAAYDRALRGIRLRVFDPTPAEASDCPSCPYFFLCPEEGPEDGGAR